MDPIIASLLGMTFADGDETENAVFRRLGELAADDDVLLHAMETYFDGGF